MQGHKKSKKGKNSSRKRKKPPKNQSETQTSRAEVIDVSAFDDVIEASAGLPITSDDEDLIEGSANEQSQEGIETAGQVS